MKICGCQLCSGECRGLDPLRNLLRNKYSGKAVFMTRTTAYAGSYSPFLSRLTGAAPAPSSQETTVVLPDVLKFDKEQSRLKRGLSTHGRLAGLVKHFSDNAPRVDLTTQICRG